MTLYFNIKKITTVLCYLSNKLGPINKLKTIKLLYYIDKAHLLKYGRFVSNDTYVKLANDLAPIEACSIINKHENKIKGIFYFNDHISVDLKNKVIIAKKNHDISKLSKSEIKIIDVVIEKYGQYTDSELIKKTYNEKAWIRTCNNCYLKVENLIADLSENKQNELLDFIKQNNETDNFLRSMGLI